MSTTAAGPGPDTATTSSSDRSIDRGTSVEVRARFDGRWCAGFEIADRIEADCASVTYRLRRTSDGSVLPALFADEDVNATTRPATGPA